MNATEWKAAAQERLRRFAIETGRWSSGLLYGGLTASAVFPLMEAASGAMTAGNWQLFASVISLAGTLLGGNLLAEQIARWHNRSEADIAAELAANAETDPAWRDALDKLLLELDTPRIVQAVLPERDWDRFQRMLQSELAKLGNSQKYADTVLFDQRGQTVHGNELNVSGTVTGRVVGGNVAHIGNIIHHYLNAPGVAQMDEKQFRDVLSRYLEWVAKRYGQLNLRGIERRERQILSLTLEDVYVSLQAAVRPERKQLAPRRAPQTDREKMNEAEKLAPRRARRPDQEEMNGAEQIPTVDMAALLALGSRLAIIGGPGSGKTTFLHIIAAGLARALASGDTEAVTHTLGLSGDLPLPIFVALSDYNRYRRSADSRDPRQGTLTAFLTHSLIRQEAGLGLPDDFFQRLLGQGRNCIVLLDGLDEVADERERALVRQAVENLAANGGIRHLLVTSRSRAYREGAVLAEEFRVAEVQPMALEQAQALAARWSHAAYDDTQAESESTRLQGAIAALEQMRAQRNQPPLIDSPLLVTIVAIVHYNQRRLPDERAELYDRCVEVLLAESHKPVGEATFALQDWGGRWKEKRALLAHLAFQMMAAGKKSGRAVEEDQLRAWLRPQMAKRAPEAEVESRLDLFVQAMRERGSLLDERDGVYSFIHLTFQEFLAAVYLADTLRADDAVVEALFQEGRIADSWWRETVLLTVGYLGLRSTDAPLALVQALARRAQGRDLALAATEVIAAAFLEQNGADPATRDLLVGQLVTPLTDPADRTSPVTRAAAGRVLAQLGDPRKGVGVVETRHGVSLPDIDWVKIPEIDAEGRREFIYQEDERRTEPTFWMARYPVTYAQFQCFIDAADGWANPEWWERLSVPDKQKAAPFEQRFKHWNHPRESVSWYQAIAFCRWLTAQARQHTELLPAEMRDVKNWRITLPTEWQWEKAARGYDGREYPWGNGYRSGYANVIETKRNAGPYNLQTTSAVGIYCQGDSPYGIADMSGNVWEWCRNEFDNPDRIQETGTERRVLRGGSWSNSHLTATAVRRNWLDPHFWNHYLGFRVVWSAFIPV